MNPGETLTGIEQLRRAVAALNVCRESFLDLFTPAELLAIHHAWIASEWDFRPDEWTHAQVRAALGHGESPRWDEHERPLPPVRDLKPRDEP